MAKLALIGATRTITPPLANICPREIAPHAGVPVFVHQTRARGAVTFSIAFHHSPIVPQLPIRIFHGTHETPSAYPRAVETVFVAC